MYHYSDTTCILFLRVRGFSQYVGYISQTCTYCLYFGWIDVSENILKLLPRLLLTFTFLWQPYLRLQQKFIIPRFNEWYFHIFWLHSLYVFLLYLPTLFEEKLIEFSLKLPRQCFPLGSIIETSVKRIPSPCPPSIFKVCKIPGDGTLLVFGLGTPLRHRNPLPYTRP